MRAKLEQLQKLQTGKSFFCYEVDTPAFQFFWHHHPEYELTFIVKGKGRRMVGDSIENFSDGDFVLLGPMLPHTWISDPKSRNGCRAVVIQFSHSFIRPFAQLPEFEAVDMLLKKATRGLVFTDARKRISMADVDNILYPKGPASLCSLLLLLSKSTSLKSKTLASVKFGSVKNNRDTGRINKVLDFVQHHYTGKITLSKAASLVHLTESAFCKCFKRCMNKTFSDYVNEIRIAEACLQLIETDKPISMIASACGFENLAYFNRVFLRKKSVTPRIYRKKKSV